jgi:Holliday junction resolvase RusA-like endonuclease
MEEGAPPLKGDINVSITLFCTKRRSDWDNFHKLSCDALSGIVYEDDSQIKDAYVAVAHFADCEQRFRAIVSKQFT